jgi:hypothetical protein
LLGQRQPSYEQADFRVEAQKESGAVVDAILALGLF